MAEKSTGQWVGAVVGAIAGFFTGGSTWYYTAAAMAQGAAVGSAVGGLIDPPKGPNLFGPRLGDLSAQTSGYGATIPRIYGQMATMGNIFWLENNRIKEVAKKKKNGKGGGGSTTTTYSYYATFAVGLCRGPIQGVRRVWVGSKLIYDASSVSIDQIAASNAGAKYFRVYTGTETQEPDDRMEATLGVGNVPAYRGLAYLVFEDYPLKDHGNSLMGAQVKVEVLTAASYSSWSRTTTVADIGVQFRVNYYFPANPTPYISRVANDVIYLTTVGSQVDSLYSLAGDFLGYEYRTEPEITDPSGYIYDCGRFTTQVGMTWSIRCDTSKTIGGGALTLSNGDNCAAALPADHTVIGVAIANDKRSVFIVTARPGESEAGVYIRDFFVIDDAFLITHSGLTDDIKSIYDFGFSRCAQYHFGAASFDSETMRVAAIIGASGGTVTVYSISGSTLVTDDVLSTPNGLSYYTFSYPTVYFSNDIIFAFSGSSYNVFTKGLITPGSVILGDIVEDEVLQSGLLTSGDIDVTALTDTVRGYRISSVAAIRAGIEPLQSVWPFDMRQHGYKLQFVRRGGAAVASIPESDLDARSFGDAPGKRLTVEREMDSQLPRRIVLTHIDPDREYDPGEQGAERLNTQSVNVSSSDLPIVMTAQEAAGAVEVALYLRWLERYGYTATLAPSWRHLEPGDVVDITHMGETHTVRLTSTHTLPDGRVEVTARPAGSATLFTPVASGAAGESTGVTLGLEGPTRLQLLDIPAVHGGMDSPCMLVAMGGYYGSWPGGVLLRSDDNGTMWSTVDAIGQPGATIGQTINALAGVESFALMDKASTLSVRMINGDLASVSEAALLNGANHFAIGAHGRWEIVGVQNCALQGDGTFVLRDFIRGRFGTEWAANTHAALDTVVHLDPDTLIQSGVESAFIGLDRLYKAVTTGHDQDEASSVSLAYQAVNMECLSPVYLNGNRHPTTNDWTITWLRRTRIGGEWRDKIDAPLSETSEAYEIEIYSDATYTTLKRTISGLTSPTATYSSANQVTDFGSNQATLYLKVYQISAVAGRGYPLVSSLPRKPSTRLLMHGNGDNNGAVFADEAGNTITPSGGLVTANDVAPVFGSTAIKFNGSNAYFTLPASFGTFGDFTIEFWRRGGFTGCYFSHPSNGTYFYNNYAYLNNVEVITNASMPSSATTWRHVALVRQGGVVTLYVDGAVCGTGSYAGAVDLSSLNFGRYAPGNNFYLSGHLDEIRITDRAIYTAPFTPPTSEFQIFTGAI